MKHAFLNSENIEDYTKTPAPKSVNRQALKPLDSNCTPATQTSQESAGYSTQIHRFLRRTENSPVPDYMINQKELSATMRSILIDWLAAVHQKYKFDSETLFLCVQILDRYLSEVEVAKSELQLVGGAALLIASKYEEIYCLSAGSIAYLTDQAYTKSEVLLAERTILKQLQYKLTSPSCFRFFERYRCLADLNEKERSLGMYLLELSLLDYNMLKYKASLVAAGALYLSRKIFSNLSWSEFLIKETGYTTCELKNCAKDLLVLYQKSSTGSYTSLYKKYSQIENFNVANTKLT